MDTRILTKGIRATEDFGKRYFVPAVLLLGLIKLIVIGRIRYTCSVLLIVTLLSLIYVALSSQPVQKKVKQFCKKEYLIITNGVLLMITLLEMGKYLYFYKTITSLISIFVLSVWLSNSRGKDSMIDRILDIVQISISVMMLICLYSWLYGLILLITSLITHRKDVGSRGFFIRVYGVIFTLILGLTLYNIFLNDPLGIFCGSFTDELTNQIIRWMSITKLYSIAAFSGDSIITMGYKYLEMNLTGNIPSYILCYNGKALFIIFILIECFTVLMGAGYYRWSRKKNSDRTREAIALFGMSVYMTSVFKSIVLFSIDQFWYLNLLTVIFVLDHEILLTHLEKEKYERNWKKRVESTVVVALSAVLFVKIFMTIPYYNSMNHAMRSDSKETIEVKTINDRKMNPVQTVSNGTVSKTYELIYEEDLKTSRIVRFRKGDLSGYYDCLSGKEILSAEIKGREARFNGLLAVEKDSNPGTWRFHTIEGEPVYEGHYKDVEALDHCSYLCECDDGSNMILDLQNLYRKAEGQADIYRIPKQYQQKIVKGEILAFSSDEGNSLVYINERIMKEDNLDGSHWIRYDNHWKSTKIAYTIRDIDIAGRSFSDNVPDSIVYSYEKKDGGTYALEGLGGDKLKEDLIRYRYIMDDTGVFIQENELQNIYSVPVKPDEEGIRWVYGLQIF